MLRKRFELFSLTPTKRDSKLEPAQLNLLPVSELHVHADGGILSYDLVKQLTDKHHIDVSMDKLFKNKILYSKPGDCFDFFAVYDEVTNFIRTAEDVSDVIYDYLRRCHEDGAIYIELTCSPDHFNKNHKNYSIHDVLSDTSVNSDTALSGVTHLDYPEFVAAVAKGIDKANDDFGIEARILIVLLRHQTPAGCEELLNNIIAHPHPYVVGIGLAGDDVHFPSNLFAELYTKAKKAGLKLTAHAGEHTGPEDIRETIDLLHVDRIGHGIACVQNKQLMEELRETKIGLEICPSSNVNDKGGKITLNNHPFKQIFDFGIRCSLNTDDPGFLDTSIGREYQKAQQTWNLSQDQMLTICRYSIEMSFAEETLKAKLLARIELYRAVYDTRTTLINSSTEYEALNRYAAQPSISDSFLKFGPAEIVSRIVQKHEDYLEKAKLHQEYVQKQLPAPIFSLDIQTISNGM